MKTKLGSPEINLDDSFQSTRVNLTYLATNFELFRFIEVKTFVCV